MKVKLVKPHTHAGVQHKPGETLDVDVVDARWLVDNKVAEALDKFPLHAVKTD